MRLCMLIPACMHVSVQATGSVTTKCFNTFWSCQILVLHFCAVAAVSFSDIVVGDIKKPSLSISCFQVAHQ